MIAWLLAFCTLQAADVVVTLYGLERGATELNPFMSALFAHSPVAVVFVKGLGVVAVVGILWAYRDSHRAREGLRACVVLMAAVVGFNLGVVF